MPNTGPLDWRLPEAHAIYWGALGLAQAKEKPGQGEGDDDLIKLRRIIYQSMLQAFHHGRIIPIRSTKAYELGPEPRSGPKSTISTKKCMPMNDRPRPACGTASKKRTGIFCATPFIFSMKNNRVAEAAEMVQIISAKISRQSDRSTACEFPAIANLTLDNMPSPWCRIDIGDTSQERTTAAPCKDC
jgi:hypothetical protein